MCIQRIGFFRNHTASEGSKLREPGCNLNNADFSDYTGRFAAVDRCSTMVEVTGMFPYLQSMLRVMINVLACRNRIG